MARKRMFPFENPGPLGVAGGLRGIDDEEGSSLVKMRDDKKPLFTGLK
jgi:hypothetical protein